MGQIILAILVFLLIPQPAKAETIAGHSAVLQNEVLSCAQIDPRVRILESFLAGHQSPLTDHASLIIQTSDKYQVDWKLLSAIAGVESTFGKRIPKNSFNAYGWSNGYYRFDSWEKSIEHVIRALKEKYINRGLDNPYKIGPVYAPPSKTWAGKVVYFMKQIENFQPQIPNLTI